MFSRRIVVTGLGLVTPLATGVKASWKKLINSESGIISLKSNQPSSSNKLHENKISHLPYYEKEKGIFNELSSTIAGVVKPGKYEAGGFASEEWLDRGDENRMALFSQYAICAAKQALNDAGWKPTTDSEKDRTGVCIGSGIGSLEDVISSTITYNAHGPRKVSPLFIPKMLINMAAGHLTMKYGFRGPNHAVSTACTTGAHSIGDASRFIQFGDADVIVAGGSEACVLPLAIAGFAKAKCLATKFNDQPEKASRPFDKDRNGFVVGEGAGMVVLEEYNHAINRGAKIYAELIGYGLSGDAHHITAPPENGIGAELAMRRALSQAKLSPESIDYINAHATSTTQGDIAENRAIKSIFQQGIVANKKKLAISSTKGSIGHLLGAAGAVEAIFTILAINNNILPPTLNLYSPDDLADFNYVPLKAQKVDGDGIKTALTNSFGFGGTNACLCFIKYE